METNRKYEVTQVRVNCEYFRGLQSCLRDFFMYWSICDQYKIYEKK